MKILAVYVERIIILAMEDHARPVIMRASINAMKDIATHMIAFHMMHQTRAISRKENTEMKRMIMNKEKQKQENNPDWLCDCCGRAGKIIKIEYPSGIIHWHCSECYHDRVGSNEPRLQGKFRRYRTDDVNLTASVNEYNNAVDKIGELQNDAIAMKTENEDLRKKLEKITNIDQLYFSSDNFYTYAYHQEEAVDELVSIGIIERRGNHLGAPEPTEHLSKERSEDASNE
jgi:hypothetical protein